MRSPMKNPEENRQLINRRLPMTSTAVSSEWAKAFTHRWYDRVWNNGDAQVLDELIHPECIAYGFPDARSTTNAEGFKRSVRAFREVFSEIHVKVVQVITEGDRIATHWSATMRHTGDGLGFAATNEQAQVDGCSIVRMKDGRIIEGWNFFDLTREITRLKATAESRAAATSAAQTK